MPQKGRDTIAQGNALRGATISNCEADPLFRPFRASFFLLNVPRALPWAILLWPFRPTTNLGPPMIRPTASHCCGLVGQSDSPGRAATGMMGGPKHCSIRQANYCNGKRLSATKRLTVCIGAFVSFIESR